MDNEPQSKANAKPTFQGYAPPTSSTVYTPNQFLDTTLPNASRGCIRLVAHLIRKTLGWSDAQGNPQNPTASLSFRQIEQHAGIGRGRVRQAIEEALEMRFIECLRFGKRHLTGQRGYAALYSLRWGRDDRYITNLNEFDGFFSGNGNLTHIPNQLYDYTIPRETLAVIRVVGIVIRNSIGYQSKYGFRRQEAELSFATILRKSGIASSSTLNSAIKAAIAGNHIRVIAKGTFDPNAGQGSRATVYGVKWTDQDARKISDLSGRSCKEQPSANTPKSEAVKPSEFDARSGPESQHEADRFRSDIETTRNNTTKRQAKASETTVQGLLLAEGIDLRTAIRLAEMYPEDLIRRQIERLPHRQVRASRTGLLIRSIEHDMADPRQKYPRNVAGHDFAAHYYAELGGNSGKPIADPSDREVQLAVNLIDRLQTTKEPGNSGREFAKFVKARSHTTRFLPQSLALAVRLHADAFAVSIRPPERRDRPALEAVRASEYRQFVALELAHLFERPELRASFEDDMASRLEACRRLSERGFQMLSTELESASGRSQLFEEYVRKHHSGLVPTHSAWKALLANAVNKKPEDLGDARTRLNVRNEPDSVSSG